jgi:hypothetical protein
MRSSHSFVEPEPALQSIIWRMSGDLKGQNMVNRNQFRKKEVPPHINAICVITRRHAA